MARQLKITAFMKPPPEKKKMEPDEFGVITIDDNNVERKFEDEDFVEDYVDIKRKKNTSSALPTNSGRQKYFSKEEKTQRKCPFYKKIPGTKFTVDAFNFGLIPGIQFYFLSHFHSDHYIGLRKSFIGTIVCSPITARLVMSQIGVAENQIIMMDLHQPIMIDDVEVVAIDACHCPGAVMLLMTLPNGKRILHTGDFRASPEMEKNIYLIAKPIDQVYLDTTYCHPDYIFPSQSDSIQMALKLTLKHLAVDPKLLIVCGTYTIGKEKVFKGICNALEMNLWVDSDKLKILEIIKDPIINSQLVTEKDHAQIHVLPLSDINHQFLKGYLKGCCNRFSTIVAFKPCGWENGTTLDSISLPSVENNVHIYGIPYSEHSSYTELERFIKFFKPRMITSTVHHSNPERRVLMFKTLARWKSSYQSPTTP